MLTRRSRRALLTTDTELKLMAAASSRRTPTVAPCWKSNQNMAWLISQETEHFALRSKSNYTSITRLKSSAAVTTSFIKSMILCNVFFSMRRAVSYQFSVSDNDIGQGSHAGIVGANTAYMYVEIIISPIPNIGSRMIHLFCQMTLPISESSTIS